MGKALGDREIEEIAELAILGPLVVGAEIRRAGLDLDDGDLALRPTPKRSARRPPGSENSGIVL